MIRTTIGLSLALVVLLAIAAGPSAGAGSACPASNPPNTLVLSGGSGQTAQLGRQFQGNLQVALANSDGCPLTGNLAGISVDFVAPGGGASGIFASTAPASRLSARTRRERRPPLPSPRTTPQAATASTPSPTTGRCVST